MLWFCCPSKFCVSAPHYKFVVGCWCQRARRQITRKVTQGASGSPLASAVCWKQNLAVNRVSSNWIHRGSLLEVGFLHHYEEHQWALCSCSGGKETEAREAGAYQCEHHEPALQGGAGGHPQVWAALAAPGHGAQAAGGQKSGRNGSSSAALARIYLPCRCRKICHRNEQIQLTINFLTYLSRQ